MKFTLQTRENILGLQRRIGYTFLDEHDGEYNFVRRVRDNFYPRFHLHVKEVGGALVCTLHLDQKKPSYQGSAAHGGEYEGDIVVREIERIKGLL